MTFIFEPRSFILLEFLFWKRREKEVFFQLACILMGRVDIMDWVGFTETWPAHH